MKESRNQNAFLVLTTLSVCLGLVLAGSTPASNAQNTPSNGTIRMMVRQSLYGNALEELVRELERLREEGESFDFESELSLLNPETLLSFSTLQHFVSDHGTSNVAGHFQSPSISSGRADFSSAARAHEVRSTFTESFLIPHSARPRASLEEPALDFTV